MTDAPIRIEDQETDTHTEGRPCEDTDKTTIYKPKGGFRMKPTFPPL